MVFLVVIHLPFTFEREGDGILEWAVEGAMLLLEHGWKIVKSEVQEMKVKNLLHESDPMVNFLKTHLVLDKDGDVTSEEVLKAFHDYCQEQKWSPPPRRTVQTLVPDCIYGTYGISKRTDIKREGTNRRGYNRLRLKKEK